MPGVHLPQHREQRLVRQQRLPQRLDPRRLGQAAGDVLAEVVAEDPLPRVELVHRRDRRLLEVDEAVERGVPPELLDREADGVEAGLGRALLQVGDRDVVLARRVGLRPAEVRLVAGQLRGDLAPALDQLLVQRVPLVVVGVDVLEPVPLADRRLEQRGRGVGVVLHQLRRPRAVVAQVEAAVEVRVAASPGRRDLLPAPLGQREVAEPLGGDDVVDRLETHRVQELDVGLEREDLGHVEDVVHRLVPVRPGAVQPRRRGAEHQPLLLDLRLPVGTGPTGRALHDPDPAVPPPLAAAGAAARRCCSSCPTSRWCRWSCRRHPDRHG